MTKIEEQIEAIEKEIRETPYHKGTEHHIGKLRAKLARLRDRQQEQSSKGSGGGGGYAVKKQGDATVVLVGPPSVGKSTLLNRLTNAKSKIAPYAFTTVSVIPGMFEYKNANIQILDVPGLISGAEEGRGRGREVLSVVRAADLLIIMTDVENLDALDSVPKALERNGIRINKNPPNVTIDKKVKGGISIHTNIKQEVSNETIKETAHEFEVKNAEITIREKLTMERLIDAFSKNRVYIDAISAINKSDLPHDDLGDLIQQYNPVMISAEEGRELDKLKKKIWTKLKFVRVYLVRPDEEPSLNNPIVMKSEATLYDVMEKLGSEFAEGKEGAKIWGTGAKFPGQEVSLSTKVQEGMQVRFV